MRGPARRRFGIGDLLRLDNEAIPRIRSFAADSATRLQILHRFDANANGQLELAELFEFVPDGDPALVDPYLRLRETLVSGLQPGAGNEDLALIPGVAHADLVNPTMTLFDYAAVPAHPTARPIRHGQHWGGRREFAVRPARCGPGRGGARQPAGETRAAGGVSKSSYRSCRKGGDRARCRAALDPGEHAVNQLADAQS